MVVAAGAQKGGLSPPPLHDLEPENTRIESDGSLEICNLQVNMADVDPGVDPLVHAPSSRRRAVWPKHRT